MNKQLQIVLGLVVVFAVVCFGSYYAGKGSVSTQYGALSTSSATLSYSNALQQVRLYNLLEGYAEDIVNLRNSQVSSTQALNLPSILGIGGATTSLPYASSTAVTGVAAGDTVMMSLSTTTGAGTGANAMGNWIMLYAHGCATNVVCWVALNVSSTAIDLSATENYVFRDLSALPTQVIATSTSITQ